MEPVPPPQPPPGDPADTPRTQQLKDLRQKRLAFFTKSDSTPPIAGPHKPNGHLPQKPDIPPKPKPDVPGNVQRLRDRYEQKEPEPLLTPRGTREPEEGKIYVALSEESQPCRTEISAVPRFSLPPPADYDSPPPPTNLPRSTPPTTLAPPTYKSIYGAGGSPRLNVIKMRNIPELQAGEELPVFPPPANRSPQPSQGALQQSQGAPRQSQGPPGGIIMVPGKRRSTSGSPYLKSFDVIKFMDPPTNASTDSTPFQFPLELSSSFTGSNAICGTGSDPKVKHSTSKTTPRLRTEQFRFSVDTSVSGLDSPKLTQEKTVTYKSSIAGNDVIDAQYGLNYSHVELSGAKKETNFRRTPEVSSSEPEMPRYLDREELEKNAVEVSAEDFQVNVDINVGLSLPSLESVLGKERYERLMRNIEEMEEYDDDDVDDDTTDVARRIWRDSARESDVSGAVSDVARQSVTASGDFLTDDLGLETHRPDGTGDGSVVMTTTPKSQYMSGSEQPPERNYQQEKVKVAFSADQIYARASYIICPGPPPSDADDRLVLPHIHDPFDLELDQFRKQLKQANILEEQSDVGTSFDSSVVNAKVLGQALDSPVLVPSPPTSEKGERTTKSKSDKAKIKTAPAKPPYELPPLSDREKEHMERIRFSVESRKPAESDLDADTDITDGPAYNVFKQRNAESKTSNGDFPSLSKSAMNKHDEVYDKTKPKTTNNPSTFRDDESMFTTVSSVATDFLGASHKNKQSLDLDESDIFNSGEYMGVATVKDLHTTLQSSVLREKNHLNNNESKQPPKVTYFERDKDKAPKSDTRPKYRNQAAAIKKLKSADDLEPRNDEGKSIFKSVPNDDLVISSDDDTPRVNGIMKQNSKPTSENGRAKSPSLYESIDYEEEEFNTIALHAKPPTDKENFKPLPSSGPVSLDNFVSSVNYMDEDNFRFPAPAPLVHKSDAEPEKTKAKLPHEPPKQSIYSPKPGCSYMNGSMKVDDVRDKKNDVTVPTMSVESIEEAKFEYEDAQPTVSIPNHLKVELSLNLASSVDTVTTSATETPSEHGAHAPQVIKYKSFGSSSSSSQEVKKEAKKGKHKRKHKSKEPLPEDSSEDIKFEYSEESNRRGQFPPALSCELSLNLRDSMDSETQGPSKPPAQPPIPEEPPRVAPPVVERLNLGSPHEAETPHEEPPVPVIPENDVALLDDDVPIDDDPGHADVDDFESAVVSTDYHQFVQRLLGDSRFGAGDAPKPSHGLPRASRGRARPSSAGASRKSQPDLRESDTEPYRQKWASSSYKGASQLRQSRPPGPGAGAGRPRPSSAKVSRASVNFTDGAEEGSDRDVRKSTSKQRARPSSAGGDRRKSRNTPVARSIDYIEHLLPRNTKPSNSDPFTVQSVPCFRDKVESTHHQLRNQQATDIDRYMQLTPRIQSGELSFMLCLPDEILLKIFAYLPHADLYTCTLVCHHFKRVGLDFSLWSRVTIKRRPLTNEMLGQIGRRRPVSLSLIQCKGARVTESGLRDLFRHCADSLKELNVTGCHNGALTGDNLILHAANRCTNLSLLDVSWCNINDPGLLSVVEMSQALHTVCVNGCQLISDESIHALAAKHGIYLHTIELFGCFNVTARALVSIGSYCKSLRTLNLGQCWKLTDTSISQLSHSLSQVTHLDLRGCKQITDNTVTQVLRNCPRLEVLALANCPNLSDYTLQEISVQGTRLTSLDVCGCKKMTSTGVKLLAMNCVNLTYLDVSSTGVTSKGVGSIASYSSRKLEVLKINFCKGITMPNLVKLAKNCKRLKKLYIYGVTTIRTVDEIKAVNPSLWIEK